MMKKESNTYSKQVIEIADFIYKFPDKKMSEVLSYFVKKCHKTERTVNRYVKQAKEYNKTRLQKQEKVRDNVLAKETENAVKSVILSRNEYIIELQNDFIELGKRKAGEVYKAIDNKTGNYIGFIQAGFNDVIQAKNARVNIYQKIANAMGWEAPKEVNLNNHFFDLMCKAAVSD